MDESRCNAEDYATASGVSTRTITNLLSPKCRETVTTSVASRLLAVTPENLPVAPRATVEADLSRMRIETMVKHGVSREEIARLSGLSPSLLAPSRMTGTILLSTERKVLTAYLRALRGGMAQRSNMARRGLPSPVMLQRQIEALAVQGWTSQEVAARAGLARATVVRIRCGEPISEESARRIDQVFKALRFREGPSSTAVRRARAAGHAPWAAWPDGQMGVPGARPEASAVDDPAWQAAIKRRYADAA